MAIRKTRRTKRRGSGKITQGLRYLGVPTNDSTKQAALEIKNIYANLTDTEKTFGAHKPQINKIFERNFGYSPFGTPKQRILMELHKFKSASGPDASPKNLYFAISEIDARKD